MLTATPTRLLSRNFAFALDGRPLGEIQQANLREKASIVLDGTRYTFANQLLGSDFLLEADGEALARAQKRVLRRAFDVTVGERSLALEVSGTLVMGGRYALKEGGRLVGTLSKTPLARSGRAELPDDLPLPVQVWLLWIGLMMWRRERSGG